MDGGGRLASARDAHGGGPRGATRGDRPRPPRRTLPGVAASRRPTLRDVAELAGASFKTVSRVVNGEAGVSAAMTRRVQAAIDQLGYRPDPTASILRRADGRSDTIAVILESLANPFSAAVHDAIVATMRERGVLVLSASTDEDPAHERAAFVAFVDRRVDGMVLMPTGSDHGWLRSERIGERHVVMVDRPAPGFPSDAVVADNRGGARRAVEHLARHGHRRIAFLGDLPGIYTARERATGFRAGLRAAGLPHDPALERAGLRDSEQARRAVAELLALDDPPTAIFAGQNLLTIGAVRALRDAAAHRRVALVGFDDVELADLLDPGVTVVAQAPSEIGRVAAELLLARIDGDAAPARRRVVPTTLIARGSGELPGPAGAQPASG